MSNDMAGEVGERPACSTESADWLPARLRRRGSEVEVEVVLVLTSARGVCRFGVWLGSASAGEMNGGPREVEGEMKWLRPRPRGDAAASLAPSWAPLPWVVRTVGDEMTASAEAVRMAARPRSFLRRSPVCASISSRFRVTLGWG